MNIDGPCTRMMDLLYRCLNDGQGLAPAIGGYSELMITSDAFVDAARKRRRDSKTDKKKEIRQKMFRKYQLRVLSSVE